MKQFFFALAIFFALCVTSDAATAVDASFGGYGTMGLVRADTDRADFVSSFLQPEGSGRSHGWTFNPDTRLGLQLDTRFSDRFSGVVQVLAKYGSDAEYEPTLEWANLKYAITPAFSVRVGRTVTSNFVASEGRLVGYTYPWARPPLELYDLMPITNLDGLDFLYAFSVGKASAAVQLSFGQKDIDVPDGGKAIGRDMVSLDGVVDIGGASFRLDYATVRVQIDSPRVRDLIGGIDQFADVLDMTAGIAVDGARARAIADRYREDQRLTIFAGGVTYRTGAWLLIAEGGRFDLPGFSPMDVFSATGGHHFGSVMPYAVVSRIDADNRHPHLIPTAGLPPGVLDTAMTLNAGIHALVNDYAAEQLTLAAGVRFELTRSSSLKVQFDRVLVGKNSRGRFVNADTAFTAGEDRVNVLSIVVDFVF